VRNRCGLALEPIVLALFVEFLRSEWCRRPEEHQLSGPVDRSAQIDSDVSEIEHL